MNQLAQFIDASAVRRQRILEGLKFPDNPHVRWYASARLALARFIATGDEGELAAAAWSGEREDIRKASIEAIEQYQTIHDQLPDFGGFELVAFREPWREMPKLMRQGVEISVAPDVLAVNRADRKVGLIKFHIVKGHALSEDSGLAAATLLDIYAREHFCDRGDPSPKHCVVVDIFNPTTKFFAVPKALKRRTQEIDANCAEIAQRWPLIERPPA